MTLQTAELLCHVGLECDGSTVAWCPVNGLIAVGGRVRPDLACVYLLSVHCPSRKVCLNVPLQGPEDSLVSVSWSPAGSQRVLLTATRQGRLLIWTQQAPDQASRQHITMEDWWCQDPLYLCSTPTSAAGGDGSSRPHVVTIRWLTSPPAWVWNSSSMQQADFRSSGIHELFVPQTNNPVKSEDGTAVPPLVDDDLAFHWVRPGALAIAALLSDATAILCWASISAYGQLHWTTTSSIQLPFADAVVAADAAASKSGVTVCYVSQHEPNTIKVAELQGNPLHVQCSQLEPGPIQLPCQTIAVANQEPPGRVTALFWDPYSNGTRFASILQSADSNVQQSSAPGGAVLCVHSLQQGRLLPAGQVSTAAAASEQLHHQQLAWLLDGMLLVAGQQEQQLYQLQPLQQIPASFMQPVCRNIAGHSSTLVSSSQAVSSSPHGVAVVTLARSPASRGDTSIEARSRLLLYNIPAYTAGAVGPVKAAAGRLLYALMLQQHSWDVVQHVFCAATQPATDVKGATASCGIVQPTAIAEVVAMVDTKVTAQQPTLKSTYSAFWDVLKLAILSATPGDDARAVSIDMRLRVLGFTMKNIFEVLRDDATARQRDGRLKCLGLAPLHSYLADLVRFELACLKTWLVRRSSTDPAAGLAQHVPCVRHVLDMRPSNLLVMLYVLTHSSTHMTPKEEVLYPVYKQLLRAVPTPPNSKPDPNWEQTLRELIPGPFHLHYTDTVPDCLKSLALPPQQLLKLMDSHQAWQQLPVLSDADITGESTRLGLVSVRPPKIAAMFHRELQLHSSFRRQSEAMEYTLATSPTHPQAVSSTRPNSLKRRHWEQQLTAVMGQVLAVAYNGSSKDGANLFDFAHMVPFEPADMAGCYQSVDGCVLAHEAAPSLDEGGQTAPKAVVDQCAHGWMYACPISGEMWMRGP